MPVLSTKSVTLAASAAASSSGWIPLSQHHTPFNVGFGAVVAGGPVTYRVEHTFDNVFDPNVTPTVFVHEDVSAAQANADGNYAFPVGAVRVTVVSAVGAGTVTLTVRQAGL